MAAYEQYTTDDFLNDASFQQWVLTPDDAVRAHWEEVQRLHPSRRQAMLQAREILESIRFSEHHPVEKRLEEQLQQALAQINRPGTGRLIRFRPLYRWMAAASVLFVLAVATYLLTRRDEESPISRLADNLRPASQIQPGRDQALLTLADGRTLILDSTANGALSNQGGVMVTKQDGRLSYETPAETSREILYNQVRTPRGGQYQLVLADGSKVWLNAASSLRFPTSFPGTERRVELEGEAYFEVQTDATKPFIVSVKDTEVKVLGTHFNINSYEDEPLLRTTLLEGRVEVTQQQRSLILNPGQQAQGNSKDQTLRLVPDVDTEEVVAWKNGQFIFNAADIETILRQASRWYDVDVRYEGKTDATFSGSPQRTSSIRQFLNILEATGKVKVRIEGRTLIVKPT